MQKTRIAKTETDTVRLGSNRYVNTLTVTSSGMVAPIVAGADGIVGRQRPVIWSPISAASSAACPQRAASGDKQFFFEKKNQKTFASRALVQPEIYGEQDGYCGSTIDKSFFASFSLGKNESFLLSTPMAQQLEMRSHRHLA